MLLIDRIETLIAAFGDKVERFAADPARVVAGCALACGLSIPVALFGFMRLSVMWRINTPSWASILTGALVCVSCYLAAALLLILAKAHRRVVPGWLLVVVLGSFILAVFADIWRNPSVPQLPASDLVFVHLRDALERTLWLSLFTLPFAAVKYSGSIVRAVRRWHNGQDYSLNISGK